MEVLIRGQAQTHRLYASMIARRRTMLGLETPKGAQYELHNDLFNDHPEGHIKCIKYSKHALNNEEHFFDPNTLIPTDGECILDNFLIEQKRRFESGEESSRFVTDEQLHFLLADMFGAGLDTTSVTLSWFLLFMALHPKEQVTIRKGLYKIEASHCHARFHSAIYLQTHKLKQFYFTPKRNQWHFDWIQMCLSDA